MPARHESLQDDLLPKADFGSDSSGRRKRVSARHQVKRLDRDPEEFALSKNGPAEEISFLRSVRICGPQFHRCSSAQVKSGPDVFADALVPDAAQPLPGGPDLQTSRSLDHRFCDAPAAPGRACRMPPAQCKRAAPPPDHQTAVMVIGWPKARVN
jgi:hypothetical protein